MIIVTPARIIRTEYNLGDMCDGFPIKAICIYKPMGVAHANVYYLGCAGWTLPVRKHIERINPHTIVAFHTDMGKTNGVIGLQVNMDFLSVVIDALLYSDRAPQCLAPITGELIRVIQ